MDDRVMSGAELKVQLTGLGLTPAWLADRLRVTTRTIIRWFDLDEVPAKVVAEIDQVASVTSDEMSRVISYAVRDGVIRTRRTNLGPEGVAECNTLPASWHRALSFRALEHLHSEGIPASVAYASSETA